MKGILDSREMLIGVKYVYKLRQIGKVGMVILLSRNDYVYKGSGGSWYKSATLDYYPMFDYDMFLSKFKHQTIDI
jgi:hypothetical protein